jgi:hypothetical protein
MPRQIFSSFRFRHAAAPPPRQIHAATMHARLFSLMLPLRHYAIDISPLFSPLHYCHFADAAIRLIDIDAIID